MIAVKKKKTAGAMPKKIRKIPHQKDIRLKAKYMGIKVVGNLIKKDLVIGKNI